MDFFLSFLTRPQSVSLPARMSVFLSSPRERKTDESWVWLAVLLFFLLLLILLLLIPSIWQCPPVSSVSRSCFSSYACVFLASESQPKPSAARRVCGGNYCTRDLFWVEIDPPSGNKGGGALQANLCCKKLQNLSFWLRISLEFLTGVVSGKLYYKRSLFWIERLKYWFKCLLLLLLLKRFKLHFYFNTSCYATSSLLVLYEVLELHSFCTHSQIASKSILLPFLTFFKPNVAAVGAWVFLSDSLTFHAAEKPDIDMYLAITSQQPVRRSWSCPCGVTAQGIWVCPLKHHQTMQFI